MNRSDPCPYPKVAIIVISQDQRPTIHPCLEALLTLDYPAYEILVVDHHTVRPEWAGRHPSSPPIAIVQTPERLGIASARNFGMAQIALRETDYIFHLDNDILVQKDCLKALVSTAQNHPQVALVAPKIYQKNGLILSKGGRYIRAMGQPILLGLGKKEAPTWASCFQSAVRRGAQKLRLSSQAGRHRPPAGGIRFIDFATGAIGLVRRAILARVGPFDTRFDPYGFEDIDWCLRIGEAGWKLALDEKARVTHLSEYSFQQETPARLYETTRHRILFAKKHLSPTSYWLIFLPYFFLRRCLMVILKLMARRRWGLIPVVIRATKEALAESPLKIDLTLGERH